MYFPQKLDECLKVAQPAEGVVEKHRVHISQPDSDGRALVFAVESPSDWVAVCPGWVSMAARPEMAASAGAEVRHGAAGPDCLAWLAWPFQAGTASQPSRAARERSGMSERISVSSCSGAPLECAASQRRRGEQRGKSQCSFLQGFGERDASPSCPLTLLLFGEQHVNMRVGRCMIYQNWETSRATSAFVTQQDNGPWFISNHSKFIVT